jgi:hypothetical protein
MGSGLNYQVSVVSSVKRASVAPGQKQIVSFDINHQFPQYLRDEFTGGPSATTLVRDIEGSGEDGYLVNNLWGSVDGLTTAPAIPVYLVQEGGVAKLKCFYTPATNTGANKTEYLELFAANEIDSGAAVTTKLIPNVYASYTVRNTPGIKNFTADDLEILYSEGFPEEGREITPNYPNALKLKIGIKGDPEDFNFADLAKTWAADDDGNPAASYSDPVGGGTGFFEADFAWGLKVTPATDSATGAALTYTTAYKPLQGWIDPTDGTLTIPLETLPVQAEGDQNISFVLIAGNGSRYYAAETLGGPGEKIGAEPAVKLVSRSFRVVEAPAAYLDPAAGATTVSVRQGHDASVRFSSNLTEKNNAYRANYKTSFAVKLYNADAATGMQTTGAPIYETTIESTAADRKSSFAIPGSYLERLPAAAGRHSYIVKISAPDLENAEARLTATVYIDVLPAPVTLRLRKPEKQYALAGNHRVDWELEGASNTLELEVKITRAATGVSVGGTNNAEALDFSANLAGPSAGGDASGELYIIEAKARNSAADDWSRDSYSIRVYGAAQLKILLDGAEAPSQVSINNTGGLGLNIPAMTQDAILALKRQIDLAHDLSINYGEYKWGELSDKVAWSTDDADRASIAYKAGSSFQDIRELPYDAYAPVSEFLLSGKTDGRANITASHKGSDGAMKDTLGVNVSTLKNKLYLFQCVPAVTTTLKIGTETVTTDANGRAAVYRPYGISEATVTAQSTANGVKYFGYISKASLASGEGDRSKYELYPVNTIEMREAGKVKLFFKKPDGTPFKGPVILRGGVYRNVRGNTEYFNEFDGYERDAKFILADGTTWDGKTDFATTITGNGSYVFEIDPTSIPSLVPEDALKFVFEVRYPFDEAAVGLTVPAVEEYAYVVPDEPPVYYPALINISTDGTLRVKDCVIALKEVEWVIAEVLNEDYDPNDTNKRDSDGNLIMPYLADDEGFPIYEWKRPNINSPFVIAQTNKLKTDMYESKADILGKRSKIGPIGPSAEHPSATLETEFLWWGVTNKDANTGKFDLSKYGHEFVDDNGEQPWYTTGSASFAYPFSSMPLTKIRLTMDKSSMEYWGVAKYMGRGLTATLVDRATTNRYEFQMPTVVNLIDVAEDLSKPGYFDEILDNLIEHMNSHPVDPDNTGPEFLQTGVAMLMQLGSKAPNNPFFTATLVPTTDPTVFHGILNLGILPDGINSGNKAAVIVQNRLQDSWTNIGAENVVGLGFSTVNSGISNIAGTGYVTDPFTKMLSADWARFGEARSGVNFQGDWDPIMELKGYFEVEVALDVDTGKWDMFMVGGGFTAGAGLGVEWQFNTVIGYVVPITASFGFGTAAEVDFKAARNIVEKGNDFLTTLRFLAYIKAFGGFGFDYSLLAAKIGIYGTLNFDVKFRWLNKVNETTPDFAYNTTMQGEVGIKFVVKILLASYEKALWSKPFNIFDSSLVDDGKWSAQDEYWKSVKHGNTGNITEVSGYGMPRANFLSANPGANVAMYGADLAPRAESRDYLSAGQRWGGGGAGRLRAVVGEAATIPLAENVYPYANPEVTNDGTLMGYISDMRSRDLTKARAVYSVGGAGSYNQGQPIDDAGFGDTQLKVAGSGGASPAFAAWTRLSSDPKVAAGQTLDDNRISAMMNSTEIMAAVYSGGSWNTVKLTENALPDLYPVVASSGNKAIVAWRGVVSTDVNGMPADENVLYRLYNGTTWGGVKTLYNGTLGTVSSLDAAMLPDGTAAAVFTIDTSKNGDGVTVNANNSVESNLETFAALINGSGEVAKFAQLTNDKYTDENAQITTTQIDGADSFVMGWHSLQNSNGTGRHDIRFAAMDKDGKLAADFPQGISDVFLGDPVNVGGDFRFTKGAANLSNLSVLWSEPDASGEEEIEQFKISGVRFTGDSSNSGMTAVQTLAKLPAAVAVDAFDAYVTSSGAVNTVIMGADYSRGETETVDVDYGGGKTGTVTTAKSVENLYTHSGTYTNEIQLTSLVPDFGHIAKGIEAPVFFDIKNKGTSKITGLTATIGGQTAYNATGLDIRPQALAEITAYYTPPASGPLSDPEYNITATFEHGDPATLSGSLYITMPDIAVYGFDCLKAKDGKRLLSVIAGSANDAAPYTGVKIGLYVDSDCETPIPDKYISEGSSVVTVSDSEGKDLILGKGYTQYFDFDIKSFVEDMGMTDAKGEIRDRGVNIYAKASAVSADNDDKEYIEFYSLNNIAPMNLPSLLKVDESTPVSVNARMNNSGLNSVVTAELQNNSLLPATNGNVVVSLLNDAGKVIEVLQSYDKADPKNSLISLSSEGTASETFIFTEKGASFTVSYETVQSNGGGGGGNGGGGGGVGSGGLGGSGKAHPNASLTPSSAVFDNANSKDITVVLSKAGYKLLSVRNGSQILEEGVDYTINGDRVTIKESYLKTLKTGEHTLTLVMSGGLDPTLTIEVKASSQGATISGKISGKPAPWKNPFTDVSVGDWFYNSVAYAAQNGLMVGTAADKFSPQTPTSRAMIVTILYRLAGSPEVSGDNPFGDADGGQYYANAVKWAAANDVVKGIGGGKFAPDGNITRQDLAVILARYANLAKMTLVTKKEEYPGFADETELADYAKDAAETLFKAGVISGYPDGSFKPQGKATRAEVAAMLQGFVENAEK